MPKTPSNKLYHLIQSLSGPEKRYFKLYARTTSGDKSSKYLQLFDAIEAQSTYDDEALIRTIYADQPIQSRKYSELKAYLYELILKSLQGFDENSSIDFRLKRQLQSVRVLYRRAHYDDALELLQKVQKVAVQYEAFDYQLEILRWQKQLAYAKSDIPFLDQELTRIEATEHHCTERLQNIAAYQNLFYRIMISIRKDALLRSKEKVARLEELMRHPLLQDPEAALSYKARILYQRIHGLYYYSIIDYQSIYTANKELLALLESHPKMLRENVPDHISTLSNLISSCGLLKKYREAQTSLDKLLKVKPVTLDDEMRIHREYYSKKLSLCISTGDFEEGIHTMKLEQKAVNKFQQGSFESSRFYFQYFYLHFGIEDYDTALEYLNKWLNQPRSVEREDLQSLARILNLIIHYEMDNNLLLEYLFRSTYRFLKKRDRVFEFEKRVLRFIRDSNKIDSRKELVAEMKNLRADFVALSQTPSESVMFQYFDFLAWLESKISGKTFAEVMAEKYRREEN